MPWMHTGRCGSIAAAVGILDRLMGRRDPGMQAQFERAAAAVDRELAGNLELTAMFDQTHQAAVFENAEFGRHGAALRGSAPDAFELIDAVYTGIPATESAMERRGPANTMRPDDLALIERWEGDVREAQRRLRAALAAPPRSLWSVFWGRLGGKKRTGR